MRKACLDSVYKLAKKNKKIIFIGSDLGAGVLDNFKKEMSDRFFMEGVSEQHITGMSAGMAKEGFIPYFNTIATFITRRNFEQNIIDLGLHNLPVRLIGNGGGLVYAPLGPTHQAIEDIALMKTIPNLTILAPCDANEMNKLMPQTVKVKGPIYIRLAKGGDKIVTTKNKKIKIGKSYLFGKPTDILFVTTGILTQECLSATEMLKKIGIKAGVLHNNTIKPFDYKNFLKCAKKAKLIVTAEEHIKSGGLGSTVLEVLSTNRLGFQNIINLGIDNKFIKKYGSQRDLLNYCNLTDNKIYQIIKKEFKK